MLFITQFLLKKKKQKKKKPQTNKPTTGKNTQTTKPCSHVQCEYLHL